MYCIKLKDISTIYFSDIKRDEEGKVLNVITSASLQENNIIEIKKEAIRESSATKATQMQTNNIILKRISPLFVNILHEIPSETYLANNLISIQITDNNYCPKYVGYVIEQQIERLNDISNKGAASAPINRQILEDILVFTLPIAEQRKMGELWQLQNTKKQLIKEILEKEKIKAQIICKRLYKTMEEK